MTKLTIDPSKNVDAADVAQVQTLFTKLDEQVAEAKVLEAQAKSYFAKLRAINDTLRLLESRNCVLNEYEEELSIDDYNQYGSLHEAGDFWVPSSMRC